MKHRFLIVGAFFAALVAACATIQRGSEYEQARNDLLYGDSTPALSLFERIAAADPNRLYFSKFPEGSWTYVGRAAYGANLLPRAQQALERATSLHREDDMAKLYLGLTDARLGNQERGLANIENGMKGIHDWIEWANQAHRYTWGQWWDPNRQIRSAIERDLKLISQREYSWPELTRDGEWLGRRVEEEIVTASRDEQRNLNREGGGNRFP
jgi:tetratricopeptide (TPR) repeat protein